MKEIGEILAAFQTLTAVGSRCALATVVAVRGSSYRKPGARMLIAEDGRTWGGVSGGCLERDVARRALGVMESGQPLVCRYDTADEQEDGFGPTGPALGCHGVIDIFVESLSARDASLPAALRPLAAAYREDRTIPSATLVRAVDPSPIPAGARVLDESMEPTQPVWAAAPRELFDALRSLRDTGGSTMITLPGSGDWFIEALRPPQRILCFGGGPDVAPLIDIGHALGWRVQVVATRPAPRAAERFAHADRLVLSEADDPALDVHIAPADAVVLMTHNYPRDARILRKIMSGPLPVYLGVLGPRHRTDRLLDEIQGDWHIGRERVHGPVGLDLGAQNPEQIALAIIAEITAVTNRASARMLSDLPVHARSCGTQPSAQLTHG